MFAFFNTYQICNNRVKNVFQCITERLPPNFLSAHFALFFSLFLIQTQTGCFDYIRKLTQQFETFCPKYKNEKDHKKILLLKRNIPLTSKNRLILKATPELESYYSRRSGISSFENSIKCKGTKRGIIYYLFINY